MYEYSVSFTGGNQIPNDPNVLARIILAHGASSCCRKFMPEIAGRCFTLESLRTALYLSILGMNSHYLSS